MKNILKIGIGLLLSGGLASSCADYAGPEPLEKNTQPPGMVTNVQVVNLPGKSVITYTPPSDQDLLYIKAVYKLPGTGETAEVKASYYVNNLTVEGFSREEEKEVLLYAVNRSEVVSDPVSVKIKPKDSPIWDVRKTLAVVPNFGGFNIVASNETKADVVIQLMEKNDLGEWVISDFSVYTSMADISKQVRGLDTISYSYALVVRDRWLNYTDTLYTSVIPLYETLLPKNKYLGLHLPGDAEWNQKTQMTGMWDDDTFNWPKVYQTRADYTPTLPHMITIDLGTKAKISRVKIWDYPEYYTVRTYYTIGCMKRFEVWGTNSYSADGSLDSWTLLDTFEAIKPSGLPGNEYNDEDYNYANAGVDYAISITAPTCKYIRIRCLENWGGSTYLAIAELQFYGDPRNIQ